MALATTEYISDSQEIMWADFKDTHALYSAELEAFIGYNSDGQLLSGKTPLLMVNGLWILQEDPEKIKSRNDIKSLNLMLKVIEER